MAHFSERALYSAYLFFLIQHLASEEEFWQDLLLSGEQADLRGQD